MKAAFVMTENVNRFINAVSLTERRAASEAGFVLVKGHAGYGKTRTVDWWATLQPAIYIRAQSGYSKNWLLTDLCDQLGLTRAYRNQVMQSAVIRTLIENPQGIVIDEIEFLLGNKTAFETLRDISDCVNRSSPTPITVVLVGEDTVDKYIARYARYFSRVAQVVRFKPNSVGDVMLCQKAMAEYPYKLKDDLAKKIKQDSKGLIRQIVNALAVVEELARKLKLTEVGVEDVKHLTLVYDWQPKE